MPYVAPRRALSTATTLTVADNAPAWLPTAGSWGQVSLNVAADVKGNTAFYPSSRSLDALWNDYSGQVWNPYLGTYGSYLFHGGGHASTNAMLDNAVYRWDAETRLWSQMSVPTYPGELGGADWVIGREPPYDSALLNDYGEVATGVPASNHSRWLPCILPPGVAGAGASGDFLIPFQASIHTGGNGGAEMGHRFNCATGTWSRFNALGLGGRGWAATCDTTRGRVYLSHPSSSYLLERCVPNTGSWSNVTPSGWVNDSIAGAPLQYAATHDMIIIMLNGSAGLRLIDAGAGTLTMVTPTITGTGPTGGYPTAGDNGGFVWCPDLGSFGAVVHFNYTNSVVKACYAPSNPYSGTWNWATLSASNSPSLNVSGRQGHWYHALQYAPALKSFFIASMAEGSLSNGGMWCFRPSEIP